VHPYTPILRFRSPVWPRDRRGAPHISGTHVVGAGCRGSTSCKPPIPDSAMLHPGYER